MLKRRRRLRSRTFRRPGRRWAPGFVPRINSPGRLRGRGPVSRRGERAAWRRRPLSCPRVWDRLFWQRSRVLRRPEPGPSRPAGAAPEHQCPLSPGPRGGSCGCKVSSARFQVGPGGSRRRPDVRRGRPCSKHAGRGPARAALNPGFAVLRERLPFENFSPIRRYHRAPISAQAEESSKT